MGQSPSSAVMKHGQWGSVARGVGGDPLRCHLVWRYASMAALTQRHTLPVSPAAVLGLRPDFYRHGA